MKAPTIERVSRLVLVVGDIAAAEQFFAEALGFVIVDRRTGEEEYGDLLGLPDAAVEMSIMRLGDQEIALQAFETRGQPYPSGSTSTDLWFQHFAIIVSDMEAAYARLRKAGRFTPISQDGPQQLPPSSGGVKAYKFRDSEGHPLELLCFPEGTGPKVWQEKRRDGLFLGIDHSAISVVDTERSISFFKGGLGLSVGEQTQNEGIEQSRMDDVADARVTVTGLQPATTPPHVELLGYHVGSRRPIPEATASNDVAATYFDLETKDLASVVEALTELEARFVSPGVVGLDDGSQAIMILDPDGHRFVVRQPAE